MRGTLPLVGNGVINPADNDAGAKMFKSWTDVNLLSLCSEGRERQCPRYSCCLTRDNPLSKFSFLLGDK